MAELSCASRDVSLVTWGQPAEKIVVNKYGWVEPLVGRVPGPIFLPSVQRQTHLTVKASVPRRTKTAAGSIVVPGTHSGCGRLHLPHTSRPRSTVASVMSIFRTTRRSVAGPSWSGSPVPRLTAACCSFAKCGTSWMGPHRS